MAQPIENYLPGVRENGLVTNEATTLGSTLAVTGAATFSSSVSFATTPTYTGGNVVPVVGETAGATLTVAQSGSVVLFNASAGTLLRLPSPVVGTKYDFVVGVTPTSGTHGIITDAGTTFLAGALVVSNTAAAGGTTGTFTANGTSNVGVSMNGTTTGGIAGSSFRAVCTSATVWTITGTLAGSGNFTTPIT